MRRRSLAACLVLATIAGLLIRGHASAATPIATRGSQATELEARPGSDTHVALAAKRAAEPLKLARPWRPHGTGHVAPARRAAQRSTGRTGLAKAARARSDTRHRAPSALGDDPPQPTFLF
jgi:hypothetical protein